MPSHEVPVFLFCGSQDLTEAEIYRLGFDDYFTYPMIPDQIICRLESRVCFLKFGLSKNTPPLNDLVLSTCEFLSNNITFKGNLNELVSKMGTNRTSLNRLFKVRFGVGTMTWFRSFRCHQAAYYLSTTFLTINEISWRVGFDDSNNFSTAFKKIYGISPSKFRQQL